MTKTLYKQKNSRAMISFKMRIVLIFLLYTSRFSYSQGSGETDNIILSGTIHGIETRTNGKKTIELNPPFVFKGMKKRIITLANDGYFKDTIRGGTGLYYIFDNKNMIPFYLRTSNQYSINYNAVTYKNKSFVEIGGADTAINRYYIDKYQNRIYVNRLNTSTTEDEIKEFLNHKRQSEFQRLENSMLPYVLKSEEAKNINYEYLSELYSFIELKSDAEPSFVPSQALRKELAIDYSNEEEYKQQPYYAKLVDLFYQEQLNHLADKNRKLDSTYSPAVYSQNMLRYLHSLVSSEYIRNDLIEQSARYHLKQAINKEAFYDDFVKYYTGENETFRDAIYDDYLRFSKLKKGTPSPEFYNYPNLRGGMNSLTDFRGKYVYIDIWATWCGNCWYELPYLKRLEEDYKDKKIFFLSLSWDTIESEWRKTIAKYDMNGIQLLANSTDKFFKEYAVHGIPRYIILDPSGKIIDYNAPRPSDKESLDNLFKSFGL